MLINKIVNAVSFFFHFLYFKIKFRGNFKTVGIERIRKDVSLEMHNGSCDLGKNVMISENTRISVVNGNLRIGDNVYFNRNANISCYKSISIGENTIFGPNVCIYDQNHIFDENGVRNGFKSSPIIIGKNCWIAANVIILRGAVIGEGSVIGAGCVIHGCIPPHSLVANNKELLIKPIKN